MLALQTLLLFFIRWGVVEGKRFGRFGWSHEHGIRIAYIRPGKPVENGYIESFNGNSGTNA
jgi:hypothetical protein